MTIQQLKDKYYFHDSCIIKIDYSHERQSLEITMDFCNWAQEGYKKGDPENLWLKITFYGIDRYDGLTGDIDYFSILDGEIKDDMFSFFILDDFNNKDYRICLQPTDIDVEILGIVEE